MSCAFLAFDALAHGGGLNGEGCHNNRKTGDYHCHRAPSIAAISAQQQQAVPQPVALEPVTPRHLAPQQAAPQQAAAVPQLAPTALPAANLSRLSAPNKF